MGEVAPASRGDRVGVDDNPQERYLNEYMTTTVRQIQLVMDEAEYEEALGILEQVIAAEEVDTNTDAVLLLLRRWDTSQGA
jgi:hypothetical protein